MVGSIFPNFLGKKILELEFSIYYQLSLENKASSNKTVIHNCTTPTVVPHSSLPLLICFKNIKEKCII